MNCWTEYWVRKTYEAIAEDLYESNFKLVDCTGHTSVVHFFTAEMYHFLYAFYHWLDHLADRFAGGPVFRGKAEGKA